MITEFNHSTITPIQLTLEDESLLKVCKKVMKTMLERKYCMPGDIISVGLNYSRGEINHNGIESVTINFENGGDKDGVQASSG